MLKFLLDLLLTTPSDLVMTEMLGILEPMCQKEEVLEIGATLEEMTVREEIYGHHLTAQAAAAAAAGDAAAAAAAAADPAVDAADPFDLLTHFLAN